MHIIIQIDIDESLCDLRYTVSGINRISIHMQLNAWVHARHVIIAILEYNCWSVARKLRAGHQLIYKRCILSEDLFRDIQ